MGHKKDGKTAQHYSYSIHKGNGGVIQFSNMSLVFSLFGKQPFVGGALPPKLNAGKPLAKVWDTVRLQPGQAITLSGSSQVLVCEAENGYGPRMHR